MTKKLLLAAAAVGVMAFAGAANAGNITTAAPRVIASEAALPTGGFTGTIASGTKMTNPVTIPAGASATYTVKYTLTGATFDGAPSIASVGSGTNSGLVNGQGGTVYIQTDGSAVAIITVENGDATLSSVLDGFTLNGAIKIAAKGAVKLSSEISVANGSLTLPIDNAAATPVVEFKPMLTGFTAVAGSAEAKLPNYIEFASNATGAQLASGLEVEVAAGTFYKDLNGAAIDAEDVIEGLTATVSGPAGAQLDKLDLAIGSSTTVEAGATDTSAVIELNAGTVSDILDGTGVNFAIDNADEVTLNGVAYAITLAPDYATGFSAATSYGPIAAGEVTLEGTNFMAPWFTLNNANNTAFLRLANNGTTATGPVFVTLKAHNGTAAPTTARVKVADSIAPNGVFQITGPELATRFGSNAQNGDLAVTIQGDGNVISGKVRVRNATGALSEQSLGNLGSSAK